jgi:repressor LexA
MQNQEQRGPHIGPDPAWARFTRTAAHGQASRVSLQSFKPDITGYRVLGNERQTAPSHVETERNSHNSSVYVSHAGRYRSRRAADLSRLPVIGEIAAGQYDVTVAFQEYDCLDHESGVMVEKALARGGAYALRVRGTSMSHVGIEPGDIIVVRPQNWADNGDFVVANFTAGEAGGSEGLATLKRFYKRRDHVFLQSATASTDPIRLFPTRNGAPDRDTVQVQGVVTMVLKTN